MVVGVVNIKMVVLVVKYLNLMWQTRKAKIREKIKKLIFKKNYVIIYT